MIKTPKKLIEVALPLDAINAAAAREKSIRHGHPSTLHLWWARRPLAAARAVIFAQMVNDPGYQQGGGFKYGVNKEKAAIERERLFGILERLVLWENTNNETVLREAREEIWKSWRETCELNKGHPQAAELFNPEKLPGFHDPFAGGGALPLEAQRLGMESYASDLNPVAVTINKAMIEIPPKFVDQAPVGPETRATGKKNATRETFDDWSGAKGLAEDVRRYGAWMRAEAQKRIGQLYPQFEVTPDLLAANVRSMNAGKQNDIDNLHNTGLAGMQAGQKLTVIAWLWARTIKSSNPVFNHVDVPLVSTFVLSSKAGKEVYVQPVVEGDGYRFDVRTGTPPENASAGTTAGKRAGFNCVMSGSPIDYKYIRTEGSAGRMGAKLMAIVAEGPRGRVYLTPTPEQEAIALQAQPSWKPETPLHGKCRVNVSNYGMDVFGDLFTPRQLLTLTTFSDLVLEAIECCRRDAAVAGLADDGVDLDAGGLGATAYAQAVGVYLGLVASKAAMFLNTLSRWRAGEGKTAPAFGRQAIAMVWDYAEVNPFAGAGGDFQGIVEGGAKALASFAPIKFGHALQQDAQTQKISTGKLISTDPPYYDNISYADLSDFFYIWLRKSLKPIFPGLYATLAVPKAEELVATPYRHGSSDAAESFFLDGMTHAIHKLAEQAHPAFPVTIYYAFKQAETLGDAGTHSTGWETFLEAVLRAGFVLTGTWPMRTENATRMIGSGTNALASSIILVCRRRAPDAPSISRREFLRELNAVLPEALLDMTRGGVNSPVAPVDLSQAIIGPGMAIFSQYTAVLEADGKPMSVRTALQLINRFFAEDDFDHDTQFCLHWFESQGWATGKFGEADVLARAKGTSVGGLQVAGVVESGSGSLRLLRWAELPQDWSPENDTRTPVWEALHQLIRALNQDGESAAGALLARMPSRSEPMRALAYRLYTLCERKGWAEEARAYNELVAAWPGIELAANEAGIVGTQTDWIFE
jgi:putative DNA methylase